MKRKKCSRIMQRILILLLCAVLVSGACIDRYKITARASSAAITAEVGAEIMMFLWNLMVNSMVATGAGELVANYDQEKLTFESFMDTLSHDILNAPDPNEVGYVTLDNGTKVGLKDFFDEVEEGTIDLPDLEEWNLYRDRTEEEYDDPEDYLLKNWDQDAMDKKLQELRGGSGGGSGPQGPEDGPMFSKIEEFLLTSGIIGALTSTMKKLWNKEIDGVDLSPDFYGLFSEYQMDNAGNYLLNLKYKRTIEADNCLYNVSVLASNPRPILAYHNGKYDYDLAEYSSGGLYKLTVYGTCDIHYADTGEYVRTLSNYNIGSIPADYSSCSVNFPIFSSYESALAFCETGSLDGCLNRMLVDNNALAVNLPAIMKPHTDTLLGTSVLQDLYAKMKAAYQTGIKTQIETGTDTDTNTQLYTDVMADAVTDTDIGSGTGTSIGTGTGTDDDTDDGTGNVIGTDVDMDIEDYKVDLRRVFPFCIPFDLIALFEALAADPVAPRFEIPFVVPSLDIEETYVIDLSFLDEQMVLLRKLELVGFIIGLMLLTGKVIKW